MTTDQMIKEIPNRFGTPWKVHDVVQWEPLGENAYQCRVLLCPDEEGGYVAYALRLPGVVSEGETVEEALHNVTDAFQGAIEVYHEQGCDIPWEELDLDRPKGSIERWIIVDV